MKKLLLFTSKTCGKCHMIKPSIKELVSNVSDLIYEEVDIDKKDGFNKAIEHEVFSLPTIIIFENEKEKKRLVSSFNINDVMDSLN